MTRARRAAFAAAALIAAACLAALGIWQIERRAWKHELVAAIDAKDDAYRRVSAIGHFRYDRETLVQAVTERGAGYWVLTPLETPGFTLLVNRGFVPKERSAVAARATGNPAGEMQVTGLLRVTEPRGAFLRTNDPAAGRWYSRDVAAIAKARGLARTAPYFVDADATPNPGGYPVGGLTVIRFPDNHMVYALTWFTLCALCLFFAWRLWRIRE